jgi:hypothetical protein
MVKPLLQRASSFLVAGVLVDPLLHLTSSSSLAVGDLVVVESRCAVIPPRSLGAVEPPALRLASSLLGGGGSRTAMAEPCPPRAPSSRAFSSLGGGGGALRSPRLPLLTGGGSRTATAEPCPPRAPSSRAFSSLGRCSGALRSPRLSLLAGGGSRTAN